MAGRGYPERPLVGGERGGLGGGGRERLKGEWSLPGGLVEVGESLADAVRREIAEETGLEVRVEGIVKVLDRITRDKRRRVKYHYVLVDFLCRADGGVLRASSDVSEARWVRRRDLAKYSLRPATLRVIEKAFKAALSP